MSVVYMHHPKPNQWSTIRASCRPWTRPFHFTQWLGDWAAYLLSKWSLLAVLEYLGTLSMLVAVASYIHDAPARLEQKHSQAWQVINTAQGKGGSGGRIEALRNLNNDHVPLVGIDLSDAYLQQVELPRAELHRCTIRAADLRQANLAGADLSDSEVNDTNFRNADLSSANLDGAVLRDTDCMAASFAGADLNDVDFRRADLRGVDLSRVRHWQQIADIRLADIAGIKNAPDGFAAWALAHGAVSITDDQAWSAAIDAAAATNTAPASAPATTTP